MITRKSFRRIQTVILIAVPIVLWVLPADFFDNGQSVCISVLLFETTCPACGMTRACMHLIHFNFTEAWAYHPFSFLVVPLLGIYWLSLLLKSLGKKALPGF